MAGPDLFTLLNEIRQSHPDIFALLAKPGVAQAAIQIMTAEDSGHPMTDAQITALLQATPYFQQTTDKARAFDILQATDPATARTQADMTRRLVDQAIAQTGVRMDDQMRFAFFVNATRNGWDAQEIKYQLLSSVNARPVAGLGSGELGKQATDIKSLANQFGVPLSDQQVMSYARQVLEGNMDMNSVQGYLKESAVSLFPSLKTALDQGQTVMQYVNPYIQIAQQEVGLNPADVNLTDQKWMNILNQVDPKTGARVSMSLDQALKTFRSDPAWGYDKTDKAAQDATQLTTALQQKFGAAA